jgi:hypothetical protein
MADSTSPIQQITAGSGADTRINENFDAASPSMLYGRRASATTGLTWGFHGGRWSSTLIANGTVTLTASATNYVVASRTTGAVSVSTSITNWNETASFLRLYQVVTGASTVTSYQDHRQALGGGGSSVMVWNPQTANYTLVLADAENAVAMNVGSANNLTVPPNSSVAFPIGTSVLVYQEGAGTTSIVAGAGVTINRRAGLTLNLAGQHAVATLIKRGTDTWALTGDLA